MTGAWRKVYDEELFNLHSSPNIIIDIEMSWACSMNESADKCSC
jgi:hypothetical protein